MVNYNDGLVQDDSGKVLGNVMFGVIRDGDKLGTGNTLGHVKHGLISDDAGNVLFNVKKGIIRDGIALGGGGDMTTRHMQNFVDSIRHGDTLNSPIDDAIHEFARRDVKRGVGC